MKKLFTVVITAIVFVSCSEKETDTDFAEQVTSLAIELHDGNVIELPGLYDSLATMLPDSETIKLGEILKKKGFTFVEGGRGNHPPNGVRYVSHIYVKEDCSCSVFKTYNSTLAQGEYEISEGISCSATKPKKE